MTNLKINAYLDFELTRKLEAFVVNALPEQSYRSDFNMLYLANLDVQDEDGTYFQEAAECDDTFLLSITNDFGNLDYKLIKTIHVADIFESDYEVMEFIPSDSNLNKYSNYHKNNHIPVGGGVMNIAFSPFGVTVVKMLNGDTLSVYGNGELKVTSEMIGFEKYVSIPRVDKIMSNDMLKIVKLAIYTRYETFSHGEYSINIFSPTMRMVREEIKSHIEVEEDRVISYLRDKVIFAEDGRIEGLQELKTGALIPASVDKGPESNINGIKNVIRVKPTGFIDLSAYGDSLKDTFSIHTIVSIYEYSNRGSIIFECGYGVTPSGFQTHHLTLFINNIGELCYNGQYSDEWISTGYIFRKNFETIVTVTMENQKYDEDDADEYVIFIHVNGKQIWPNKRMYTKTEKIYIWRAMEAFRTYNDVCMKLPSPHPINGGLDSKTICAKKLLQESGFITTENLMSVYQLYVDRPRPSKADPVDFVFGSDENTTIKKVFFGQDSEKDLIDREYYLDGGFSEILLVSPSLGREEIDALHLLNILKIPSVKI